jgi:hypothetical protein
MTENLPTPATPGDYSAPIRVALERAGKRLGIAADSLYQWLWGHTKAVIRFRILIEEYVNAGAAEDARLLLQPMNDLIDGAPVEELEKLIPIEQSADSSEDVAQIAYLLNQDGPSLKRWISEMEDDVKKRHRLIRSARRRYLRLIGELPQ